MKTQKWRRPINYQQIQKAHPQQIKSSKTQQFNLTSESKIIKQQVKPKRQISQQFKEYKQNVSYNFPSASADADAVFDYYYHQMLLLQQCQPNDIVVLTKNPLVYQEKIVFIHNKSSQNEAPKSNKKKLRNQEQIISHRQQPKTVEYKQNQFLFNYKQKAEEKQQKRKMFLQQMQAKIAQIERQTQQIEHIKQQQISEIQQIKSMNNDFISKTHNNLLVNKIDSILNEEQQVQIKPRKIIKQMDQHQINSILEQEFQANEQLLLKINSKLKIIQPPQKMSSKKQMNTFNNKTNISWGRTMKKIDAKFPPKKASKSSSKMLTKTIK